MAEPLVYPCPSCGCEVRVGKPCPGCKPRKAPAAPKPRSWEQDAAHDGLDLPDEDFDYDDFVAREFGGAPHKATGRKWYWWLLGVIVLAAMAAFAFS